jgi:hypothetical protein
MKIQEENTELGFALTDTAPSSENERQLLLVEYEAAQSSAQHHDAMLWQATYTVWSATVILLGLALGAVDKAPLRPLVVAVSILGICLTWAVEFFARDLRAIKNFKYERCKFIEKRLGMQQHTGLTTPRGRQSRVYLGISSLFTAAWLLLLLMALMQ